MFCLCCYRTFLNYYHHEDISFLQFSICEVTYLGKQNAPRKLNLVSGSFVGQDHPPSWIAVPLHLISLVINCLQFPKLCLKQINTTALFAYQTENGQIPFFTAEKMQGNLEKHTLLSSPVLRKKSVSRPHNSMSSCVKAHNGETDKIGIISGTLTDHFVFVQVI